MYLADILKQWRQRQSNSDDARPLPRTVYALGATSMLTDVASEMAAAILPIYFLLALRLSPAEFGAVDGVFRGGAALFALLCGAWLAHLSTRLKLIAGLGYACSTVARIMLPFVFTPLSLAAVLALERFGKGMRVAPRDALLAACVKPDRYGHAFGMHRAWDAAGALLGPLIATFFLWRAEQDYQSIFYCAIGFSCAGLFVFWRYAPSAAIPTTSSGDTRLPWREVMRASFPPANRRLLPPLLFLSLFCVSETMLYAQMQQQLALQPWLLPLLPLAVACAFMLFATPCGKLADRFGAIRICGLAHLFLLPLYACLAWNEEAGAIPWPALCLLLAVTLGGFFAATDGVVTGMAAAACPPQLRSLGLGWFAAALALVRMLASFLFGFLWQKYGFAPALWIHGAGLCVAFTFLLWRYGWRLRL